MEKTNGAASILNLTAQAGLANLPNIGKVASQDGGVSFTDTFMKTSGVKSMNETGKQPTGNALVKSTSAMKTNVKTADDIATKQTDKSLDENGMKDLAKEVKDVINQIKDKIKDSFEVTDDEIEEVMDVLGLTMVDLLNGQDLRNVVMELTGVSDSIELLTNVEVYDGLKEITAFADNLLSEVSDEFSLTKDQLVEIVNSESFKDALAVAEAEIDEVTTEETEVISTAVNETENKMISEPTDKQIETLVSENTVSEAKQAVANNSETDTKQPEIKVEVTKTEEARTENPVVQQTDNNSKSGEKKNNLFKNDENQNIALTQTQTTQTVTTVGDIVETVTTYTSYADTENIMRQVTDFVKVNITGDVTEMEMQLHPASLGTVNMQINAQNGQVTAHLTVQNELVKSILEAQMVKLQETFNEQGTKVTAIEISVANYNLDSKNDNSYTGQESGGRRGNGRRNINLGDIDSLESLTEEEQLEAKVMEMNGSSVNYTA